MNKLSFEIVVTYAHPVTEGCNISKVVFLAHDYEHALRYANYIELSDCISVLINKYSVMVDEEDEQIPQYTKVDGKMIRLDMKD